ncbi:hypothetical protein L204_102533 [Cryptococcus depauperatus]
MVGYHQIMGKDGMEPPRLTSATGPLILAWDNQEVRGIEEDVGFDWTDLWEAIQHDCDSVPAAELSDAERVVETIRSGLDWMDLWDDYQRALSQQGDQKACNNGMGLPPSPTSLSSATPTQLSTPKTQSYATLPLTSYSTPSLLSLGSSPSSRILQTPSFSLRNEEPQMVNMCDNFDEGCPDEHDANPFLMLPQQKNDAYHNRTSSVPQIFHLPWNWSAEDTPTPVRYHPETYQVPRQPQFSNVRGSIAVTAVESLADGCVESLAAITWITHLSTSGGLIPSLNRLLSLLTSHLCPAVQGISMFVNHPRKQVKLDNFTQDSVEDFRQIVGKLGNGWQKESMVHGVHTVNLLSGDAGIRERSKRSVIAEMNQVRSLGLSKLIIHLGSGGSLDPSRRHYQFIQLISDLQDIISSVPDITLALENTVHPSPHSLTTLSCLVNILSYFPSSRLGLCLDLSHLHVCEFDLNTDEGREKMWDLLRLAGKRRLICVHVSDNYVAHGGSGDRHASIGTGHITLSSFRTVLSHPFLSGIPHLLETPPYYKHFRPNSTLWSMRIYMLETERADLERSFLDGMVRMTDEQWSLLQEKLWIEYKKRKKTVESKIYKIVLRRGGEIWRKFKKGRKAAVRCCRAVESVKRNANRLSKIGGIACFQKDNGSVTKFNLNSELKRFDRLNELA